MTSPIPQTTDFTRDVLGRYICNGFDEAMSSGSFDTVIVGAGAFGSVVAQHLLYRDHDHRQRTLVLEAGPFLLPEHVQNLPMLDLNVPGPASSDPGPQAEVWGMPWVSSVPGGFVGLAYCVGGRSLYWGGWSPQPLAAEMSSQWPPTVVADLTNRYFKEAADQLGVSVSNDFVYGPLQNALRLRVFNAYQTISGAVPFGELPDYFGVPKEADREALLSLLGLPTNTGVPPSDNDLRKLVKLEAPLAVQSRAPSPGFFALNKFSGVPLLTEAARAAYSESPGDNSRRRLMLVPRCHVIRLRPVQSSPGQWTVTAIDTNLGSIALPPGARVVLAMATLENTRMALASFGDLGIPNGSLMGANLQVHMRSNRTIRIPKSALPGLADTVGLQAAALLFKARRTISGKVRHLHLQITASGLEDLSTNAEAKLYKLIPDIDTVDYFREMSQGHIVIAIRTVAEMESSNPGSHVRLSDHLDEFGIPRADVAISPTQDDSIMWDESDAVAEAVATALAGGSQYELIACNRDGLGTTYHEAGTLAMGQSSNASVTNSDARFHAVDNVYVTGPALFPTCGSPNPMLTGVALARRLADHLA